MPLRYIKYRRAAHYRTDFRSEDWGPYLVLLEIDDQRAMRQVNIHESGQVLRYDRSHWCDDYGHMAAGKFSRKPKAASLGQGEFIDAAEFEQQWKLALKSPLWTEQLLDSREREWGTWAQRQGE
ncbi:MAG: hypothetical protein SH850_18470 [Planctomycetaceae bacterium]|nr:hypothetical protein [Planctomycetaceae bacterium]